MQLTRENFFANALAMFGLLGEDDVLPESHASEGSFFLKSTFPDFRRLELGFVRVGKSMLGSTAEQFQRKWNVARQAGDGLTLVGNPMTLEHFVAPEAYSG